MREIAAIILRLIGLVLAMPSYWIFELADLLDGGKGQ